MKTILNELSKTLYETEYRLGREILFDNLDEAWDHMRNYVPHHNYNICYAMLFIEEDGYHVHERTSQPCYGEMRAYGEKSINRPNDPRPTDLHTPFPEKGNPIGAVSYHARLPQNDATLFALNLHCNPEISAYRDVASGGVEVILAENHVNVFVKTSDFDATQLVAFFRKTRMANTAMYQLHQMGVGDKEAYCLGFGGSVGGNQFHLNCYTSVLDLWRIYNQQPNNLTEGTWYNRYDYNRPHIDFILGETGKPGGWGGNSLTIKGSIESAIDKLHNYLSKHKNATKEAA